MGDELYLGSTDDIGYIFLKAMWREGFNSGEHFVTVFGTIAWIIDFWGIGGSEWRTQYCLLEA